MSLPLEKKIGILACSCDDKLNLAAGLDQVLKKFENSGYTVVKAGNLCAGPDAKAAAGDLKASGVDSVVALGCSVSSTVRNLARVFKEQGFSPDCFVVQDFRFQGVWGLEDKDSAQEKLISLIDAGIRRLKVSQPMKSYPVKVSRRVAVFGAGLAGLEAASRLGDLGYGVDLFPLEEMEKAPNLEALYPGSNYKGKYSELVEALENNRGVRILSGAKVAWIRGQIGRFRIRFTGAKGKETTTVGAILLSTLWAPEVMDATSRTVVGDVGADPCVRPRRTHGSAPASRIVSAADAHDPASGLGGDARVCLVIDKFNRETQLLSQWAVEGGIKLREKGIEVMVLARDVKVAQPNAEARYRKSREMGVQYIKYGDSEPDLKDADGRAWVSVKIPDLSDQTAHIPFDRVIAAPKLAPGPNVKPLAEMLKLELDESGFFQGPYISLFPIQTSRPGILALGSAKGPETWDEAMSDASAAVQDVCALLGQESFEVQGPKAEVDALKCAKCLTCVRSCPHGAIEFSNDFRAADIDPLACQACGVCAAECPAKAIQLPGFTDAQMLAEIGALKYRCVEVRHHAYGKGHPLYDESLLT